MAFSKIILNNQTLMDVTTDTVEASKLLSGETATAASGQKVTGTLVQSNDFVITLTKNQSDDWEPDCTFAEAVSAYNAGKNIAAKASTGDAVAVQIRTQDQTTQCFFYIEEYFTSGGESGFNDLFYQWTETGMERQDSAKLYFTENADAVPANVLSGKKFYNADGYQVGTLAPLSMDDVQLDDVIVNPSTEVQEVSPYTQLDIYEATGVVSGNTVVFSIGELSSGFYGLNLGLQITVNGSAYYGTVDDGGGNYYYIRLTTDVQTVKLDFRDSYDSDLLTSVVEQLTIEKNGHITCVMKSGYTATAGYLSVNIGYSANSYGYGLVVVGAAYLQSKTITPTTSQQVVTPTGAALGFSQVTVNAMPTGTAGTPTATKGTVSNHSISVTPSVTNTTGYITGGTKTGTAVTVTAAELVSGTLSITSNSIYDVTQYASVDVEIQAGRDDSEWILGGGLSDITGGSYSYIRSGAFYGTSIVSMDLPNAEIIGEKAFAVCNRLTNVSMPNVTLIYEYAFASCFRLAEIYLPKVNSMRSGAFYACASLTTVDLPAIITVVTSAFALCSKLISISIPNAKYILANAFEGCTSLQQIYFPEVIRIDSSAFKECSSLISISCPKVESICNYAFQSCSQVTQIYFPLAKSVPAYAFAQCINLSSIELPLLSSVPQLYLASLTNLTTVSFAAASAILPQNCFSGYSKLVNVYLPNITSVGSAAFQKCIALSTIRLPKLSSTPASLFYECTSLHTVILDQVGTIANQTFSKCVNLISVYLLKSTMCTLANVYAFNSTPIYNYSDVAGRWGSIFVPASLYDTYRSATNWTTFADRFVSLTDAEIEALLA